MRLRCSSFVIAAVITTSLVIARSSSAALEDARVTPKDPYIGAIVIDADTGEVLFEDHADAPVYPASVVKIMDLLIIEEKIEQGAIKTNDAVRISREASRMGGTEIWADPRETFTVDALTYALMVRSANDAAVALAEHIAGTTDAFVQMMNDRAKALGLNSTVYHSVNGLPATRKKGELPDVTTARDMAALGRELVKHPDVFRYTATKHAELRDGKTEMDTHNRLLYTFEGCDGLKTGWTREAGYSIVATAKRNGRRLIAAVMGSKGNRGHVRDAKTSALLSVAFVKMPPPPAPAPVATNAIVSTNVSVTNVAAKETPPAKSPRSWKHIWILVGGVVVIVWLGAVMIRRRSRTEFE
jgi:serine-type D-Ala-D-Ala carboxypeptidase (penicillin-binding protein 5/6)